MAFASVGAEAAATGTLGPDVVAALAWGVALPWLEAALPWDALGFFLAGFLAGFLVGVGVVSEGLG
jgi:hypothetical protein